MRLVNKLWLCSAAVAASFAIGAPAARADLSDLEVGGFLGLHVFSDTNELGIWDEPGADSLKNGFTGGLRLAYAVAPLLSFEGEALIVPTEARDAGASTLAFGYRLHGLIHFTKPDKKFRPFLVAGFGGMSSTESDGGDVHADSDAMLHGGLGLKYAAGDRWGVRLDGRVLLPPSTEDNGVTLDYEVLVGGYYLLGAKEKKVAAPVERKDTDGDGLYDDEDKCPTEAEDADGFEDENGCPDPDNDGDGVLDADDQCRDQAEVVNGIDDADGCPETDDDGDGLFGSADSCPTEAEDADGFEDTNGCPDPDNDGDGVLDAADDCDAEPETDNGYKDADGCPDEVPVEVAKFTGTIKGINFQTGSDVILKNSYKILDAAAKVLTDFPDQRMEIQGHTDDVGDDEKNLDLSQRRADSVKNYLVGKGIDEGRLEAKGFGETAPVADITGLKGGKLKAAQAQNRRVEFKLIK
jgi:OOP family OmpA-OmpF porin